MKNKSNISFFRYAFIALVFMGALTACVNDEELDTDVVKQTGSERLAVAPTVSESPVKHATTRTTTPSDDALQEKTLKTLDVFVEHITGTTGDGTFLKQYHLPNATLPNVTEGDLNKLADRWRQEGLEEGEKYNIYVAANNPLTTGNIATVEALKALSYDEVTAGVAIVNEDNNSITWAADGAEEPTTGNIYKVYNDNPGSSRFLTKDKMFMMDGVHKEWTPDPASLTQTFDVTLNRAAAKIVLNLKFDADFLTKLQEEGVEVTGSPAWRFNNFAFGAPVFTPDTAPTVGVEVHNSDFNIFHNQEFTGDDKHATITTYSYPSVWTDATGAPSLVVSVGYTQGTGNDAVTTYNYYRIPIVSKETTSLNRNTIYVIDATIKTRGSDSHEDVTEMSDLIYEVLPWNDENNSAAIHDEVQSVQHYYFKVNPKIYTLRGDGNQSVDLNYLKASGTKVNWKLFTYDANGNQTGVVANNANNAVRAWFYDNVGNFTTRYGEHTGSSDYSSISYWDNMGVTITQSNEGTSGTSGTITVTSKALTNKAIKYIRLRVYLDEEVDGESLEDDYHQDIIIRHFPTDNIQSFTGSWSSRYGATQKTAGTGYGTNVQFFANPDNYIRSEETRDNAPGNNTWSGHPSNWDNYTTEQNAYAGTNNYYYWRTVRGSWWGRTLYTYHRARYQNAVTTPVTWVDYDQRISGVLTDDNFISKVYSGGVMHKINPNANNWIGNTNNLDGLNNNHMYVIQISSTSDKYVLGRPYVNQATHQSDDDVVSPAFMIASQLGAVTPFQGAGDAAAIHCSTYMEVGDDAARTRYTGWRLPTPAEIEVIIGYQQGDIDNVHVPTAYRVMREVLTGSTYWALNGEDIETGYSTTYSGYVRCVRDLSAEEVDRLNGFDKIIEKYQN